MIVRHKIGEVVVMSDEHVTSKSARVDLVRIGLAEHGLAVQRTRMSADRTLMAVIRTSLSLVSFGFTISQIFRKLTESKVLNGDAMAGRHFGVALVLVGITMLVLGSSIMGNSCLRCASHGGN